MVIYGALLRCLDPILTIAACLSYRSPFVSPFENREEADEAKRRFIVPFTSLSKYVREKRDVSTAGVAGQESEDLLQTLQLEETKEFRRMKDYSDPFAMLNAFVAWDTLESAGRGNTWRLLSL